MQDLSVSDCDWQHVPSELLRTPLTRLQLRFADFAEGEMEPFLLLVILSPLVLAFDTT
jgi:hypothetical protein